MAPLLGPGSADPANNISFLATIENAYRDIVRFETSDAVVEQHVCKEAWK